MDPKKISFIGDIMCEKIFLEASYIDGKYEFEPLFSNIKEKLKQSDYVIANLETVFAGQTAGFTKELLSFNTPDDFLIELADSGINVVSIANNHCLDRGVDGLKKSIRSIESSGLKYFGGSYSKSKRKPYEEINVDGFKVALIGYTYGTNAHDNKVLLQKDDEYLVNMLNSQEVDIEKFNKTLKTNTFRGKVSRVIRKFTTLEQRLQIKKFLNIDYNFIYTDVLDNEELSKVYTDKLKSDIRIAKEETDYVIVFLHAGGQFNLEPGSYVDALVRIIKDAGANEIVGHHPHVVQKSEWLENNFFVSYSLGNFSISPSSIYVPLDNLPQYGIIYNIYINNNCISKRTFSIIKMVEDKRNRLTVYPVFDLYNNLDEIGKERLLKDCKVIYERYINKMNYGEFKIEDEYIIK